MKYGVNVYYNENVRSSFVLGYQKSDPLKMSSVVIFPDADSPEEAANVVWTLLNRDDRPNGDTERSLSVGDVVKIIVPPTHVKDWPEEVWLAVEIVGWKRIDNPLGVKS